ncbi:MAG: hypothetical protein OQL19_04590 [Gammaproteobacteria bacterium]|nr:hypothetical protein [Gammaproteobacteria bacterium]
MTSLSNKTTQNLSSLSVSKKIIMGASCLLFSQLAFSDATVVYEQFNGASKTLNSMAIKDGKIRFTPPNQNDNFSLYDSQSGSLTHVDMAQKKYLAMSEKDIAEQANQAKKQMDTMRQNMMDRMKDMPPEQKKQVEQMMNNHLSRVNAQKNPPKVEQKNTSKTETISGIECTVHESYIDGIKNSELCVASPDNMGLDGQDAQALMAMQGFMKRMQKVAQTMMGNSAASADIQGIPLRTKLFAPDGSVKLETQLKSITTDGISSDKMSIPADFTAMQMPGMPIMK